MKVEVGGIIPHISHHIIILIPRKVPLVKSTHQIRFWHDLRRFDESNVPSFADSPCRWGADPKRLAVQAVPDKASSPETTVQFLRVCFNVDERPYPDRPKVSNVSIPAGGSFYGVALANVAYVAQLLR